MPTGPGSPVDVTRGAGPPLRGRRVVVISSEQPGRRMAGPAVRALSWATELAAAGAEVLLAVPESPDREFSVPVVTFGRPSPRGFHRLAGECDVVIAQPQRVDVAAGLHRGGARVVYDMYVPSYVEYPASMLAAGGTDRRTRRLIERNPREYAAAISSGDGFLVASHRQKDYLWGALGQAGRLQAPASAHAEARPEVVVAPFGLSPDTPPEPQGHALKGELVAADAFVALWAGGVWNWFDPATVIEGVRLARARDPRITLVFLAAGHPSAAFIGQDAASAALRSPAAQALMEDGAVVFADSWVPHQQRWAYLRDADVGVCGHFASPETRLSFRTRFLDHLWSGLPTLTTEGGVLSEEICSAGAGICLPAGAPDAWADALVSLAADPQMGRSMSAAARRLAADYTWPTIAHAVVGLVQRLAVGDAPRKRRPRAGEVASYLAVALENRLR